MASLRHRRGIGAAKGYDDYIHDDDGSGTAPDTDTATDPEEEEEEDDDEEEEEEEEEEDGRRLHLGLHSMTAKGIQHLCSELLEIKKASEQDFSANVYLSYLSFIRMFQEAGDLDKNVHHLKRQVMAHRRLVQHVSTNCLYSSSSSSMVLPSSGGSKEEAADMDGIGILPYQREHDEELELEVLLSEHRMDEALQLLELQGQALQTMQQQAAGADDDAEAIAFASSVRALSARKARVAARLVSVAENPRTPRPELLRALSGLCRLGDAERANHLLFELHRASVVRGVEDLRASQGHVHNSGGAGGGNYIKDLARVVFSSIVRTSRSFVALHGHPSPYTPRLVRWAREEMEDLSAAFSEYVRSMSSPATAAHSLALALEAAECAVSYSPLLRAVDVVASERDVVALVVPCVRDAVAMYGRHLREVVRLLVASDAWVLGRFLMPPGVVQAAAGAPQAEYCLLTTNGRKFVTLIQEVVEDVAWPLHSLGIGTNDSVGLQLVAELFREYMHSIVELIPRKEAAAPTGDERYTWQLAVLINCTTLVSLFPTMASGVFRTPPSPPSSSGFPVSAQREVVASLISLIKEASGQVWSCFCQQFIRDTMSSSAQGRRFGSRTPPPQAQDSMMPSMALQVVFLRVRRLTEVYGAILSGEDGTMKKLLRELMEAMICWLSSNLDSWAVHGAAQVQLDVHFLLEFAQLGGFCSESIRSSALDLLIKAQEKMAGGELDDVDEVGGGGWAADAAKHAVQVLLAMWDGGVAAVEAGEESDEMARRNGSDEEAGQEEAPEDEDETGTTNKSSDEFISLEDEDDGVRMPAAALSSKNQKPGYSEMGDGEERTNIRSGHHPELEQAEGGSDDNVTQDEEGICHDAVQQQVEEQSSSSWEDIIDGEGGGGGSSRTRRQSTLVMVAGKNAPSRSRKKREAVSRSSKARWHI
ncbi:exocyst complex component EXO84B-like [Miscanthus floridulus]|uniref:exocyst complex component EXO84B-like n=1 Tax=Miscanthus floridulus TaxID=154761 RepID=UPI0034591294